eukprot:m.853578 g.853578  ORF g.853578 m.853578 type:complete len:72 (-) comp23500_c0_seq28:1842-2057(-)
MVTQKCATKTFLNLNESQVVNPAMHAKYSCARFPNSPTQRIQFAEQCIQKRSAVHVVCTRVRQWRFLQGQR